MELKNYNEAISYFILAIESKPNFAPAHANLGVLYDRMGDHKRAI